MSIETVLAVIDRSFGSENSTRQPNPGLGRRRLLTIAAIGTTVTGTMSMIHMQLGRAAENRSIAPEKIRLPQLLPSPQGVDKAAWEIFRRRFIDEDGRVIDTGNHGVSHTEGQGVGMLMAVAFDDRATFERIWGWTAANLSRGSDALHAWRYVSGVANPVTDTNNATDGDIYIAAALVRASVRWSVPDFLQAGQAIARDLLALTVMDVAGRTVLLPAAAGFVKRDHVVVNLSYYVFPLLTELQMVAPSPLWDKVITDGRKLVDEARFGERNLPPDWLQVSTRTGEIAVADEWPPRFSFDAVRIPLFLAWAGGGEAELARFSHFWGERPARAAAWVDLGTDAVAPYNVSNGVVAIATLAMRARRKTPIGFPAVTEADDYYSASLNVIARIAGFEAEARITAAMDT
jgi:endo-1,4-beta-D-glucanase Y